MFNYTTFHSYTYAVGYSVLARLICTTSNVNPDSSKYFCSKRFKVSLFILLSTTNWYKLVNKRLHCAIAC